MNDIEETIQRELEKVPAAFFKKLLEKKLKEVGVKPSRKLIDKLYDHIAAGEGDVFGIPSFRKVSIKLDITEQELEEVSNKISSFLQVEVPKIIQNTLKDSGRGLFCDLKKKWNKEHKLQVSEYNKFKKRLERRWSKPLSLLNMLLTIARELGDDYASKTEEEYKETYLETVLSRLHCRACQVTAEIITLLESGYADGAMARWRTLHEITTVAYIIDHYGEDIAERYAAHEAIENKAAIDDYEQHAVRLGYEPLPAEEKAAVMRDYNAAIEKYGKDFGSHYGWAAHYLNNKRVTLFDLEKIVERDSMRSYYQMASYNVHATAKGMTFRLGIIGEREGILAGASNAGIAEPGINTAYALTQIAVLLYGGAEKMSVKDIVGMQAIIELRDEIVEEFNKADEKLEQDHKDYIEDIVVAYS